MLRFGKCNEMRLLGGGSSSSNYDQRRQQQFTQPSTSSSSPPIVMLINENTAQNLLASGFWDFAFKEAYVKYHNHNIIGGGDTTTATINIADTVNEYYYDYYVKFPSSLSQSKKHKHSYWDFNICIYVEPPDLSTVKLIENYFCTKKSKTK